VVAITSSYMLPCDADSNVVDDNNINQDHAVAYLTKIASIDVLMCCIVKLNLNIFFVLLVNTRV